MIGVLKLVGFDNIINKRKIILIFMLKVVF